MASKVKVVPNDTSARSGDDKSPVTERTERSPGPPSSRAQMAGSFGSVKKLALGGRRARRQSSFNEGDGGGRLSARGSKVRAAKAEVESQRLVSMTPEEMAEADVLAGDSAMVDSRGRTVSSGGRPWYIILPYSRFRITWDMMTVVLICYSMLATPLVLAFEAKLSMAVKVLELVIDGVFMADVILNFFTAMEDMENGQLSCDLRDIWPRYLKGWFFIDLISAVPLHLILEDQDETSFIQLAKTFKIFRLMRVARMLRIQRIFSRLEYYFVLRHHVTRLISFCSVVLVIAHFAACGFYATGAAGCKHLGDPELQDCANSWLENAGVEHGSIEDKYVAALYWTVMAVSTVGFGDIATVSSSERQFAIFVMMIGASVFAYGVSHVVHILNEMTADTRKFRLKLDRMNAYMAQCNVPMSLRMEVRDFLRHIGRKMRERALLREENELLSDLSFGLRAKMALSVNKHFLMKMPFFAEADEKFVSEVGLRMRSSYYSAGEDVVREGEWADEASF